MPFCRSSVFKYFQLKPEIFLSSSNSLYQIWFINVPIKKLSKYPSLAFQCLFIWKRIFFSSNVTKYFLSSLEQVLFFLGEGSALVLLCLNKPGVTISQSGLWQLRTSQHFLRLNNADWQLFLFIYLSNASTKCLRDPPNIPEEIQAFLNIVIIWPVVIA